jgi:ubiquinone/menaquinone biosynthesis C-methylase UbiE
VSKDYNAQVAFHYSKYRPPLHEIILSRVLDQNRHFDNGLDIGCGTGKSSKPLSKFCVEVVGIDPSKTMIDSAEKVPSITYICGDENTLTQFQSRKFDVVTFAGSLSYTKNAKLKAELKRICREKALIIVYDFEVRLSDFLPTIGLNLSKLDFSDYDHSINISDWKEFKEEVVFKEQIKLNLKAEDLAHFILSHSTWHEELVNQFEVQDPFAKLVSYLKSKRDEFRLPANIFYSRYTAG